MPSLVVTANQAKIQTACSLYRAVPLKPASSIYSAAILSTCTFLLLQMHLESSNSAPEDTAKYILFTCLRHFNISFHFLKNSFFKKINL